MKCKTLIIETLIMMKYEKVQCSVPFVKAVCRGKYWRMQVPLDLVRQGRKSVVVNAYDKWAEEQAVEELEHQTGRP